MSDRSLGRSVGNFCLALLNATLILAALCLWFAWGALTAAERVSARIEEAARTVLPLRTEIVTLTEEIVATRTELARRRSEGATESAALYERIADLEVEVAALTSAVMALDPDPETLIERAVTSAFDGLGESVADILTGLRGSSAKPGS